MAKKSKSFNKHVYSLIAVIVLLVAAGIASYAVAPPGAATHGTLYTDEIRGKAGDTVQLLGGTVLIVNSAGVTTGPNIRGINDANQYGELANGNYGVKGHSQTNSPNGAGVYGEYTGVESSGVGVTGIRGTNTGKLGTANAGVEGTNTVGSNGMLATSTSGVAGTGASAGITGVSGSSPGTGVNGQSTSSGAGVRGNSNSGYGVQAYSTTGDGLYSTTLSSSKYAGKFEGGKGLYASKIEFGAGAFDESDSSGLLVIATKTTVPCTTVCFKHGSLGCYAAFTATGTEIASGCIISGSNPKYCWCGQA